MADQRNFLTRLLGGSGQVARAGQQRNSSLLGPRFLSTQAPMSFQRGGFVSPSPVGLLTPEMLSAQQPVINQTVAPAASVAQTQPQRSLLDEIERKSTPAPSLLGRIGGGIRSAGKELGGLFEGEEGQLRARELSKALMTGPTRVPVSFGQSLVEGLASGGEAIEARQKEQAMLDMAKAKIAAEKSEKEQEKLKESRAARSKAYAVVSGVDDAMDILDEYSDNLIGATGFASILKNIPTTGANKLNFALDTIKAQLGFAELNAMRQASPTGGALGQVTERELDFLQRTIKALETELPSEDLRANLTEVRNVMMAIANGVEDPRVGKVISLDEKLELDAGGESASPSSKIPTYNRETGEIELK